MRRSTRFLIGLGAALLTYGMLTAFMGPRYLGYRGWYPYRAYGGERYNDCGWRGQWHRPPDASRAPQTPQNEPATPTP